MQSQQKRLKWSRGETAEALEERTDTGITQASVEFMENCIPDIYGNISRRPGLSLIKMDPAYLPEYGVSAGFRSSEFLQVFPFYITEDDFILIGCGVQVIEFIRIKDKKIVYYTKLNASESSVPVPYKPDPNDLVIGKKIKNQISFSQQNNFLIAADYYNIFKIQFTFDNQSNAFTPQIETFRFSAGWYAPYGTQTKQVTTTEVPGLNVSGHFYPYTYTYRNGDTNVFSWTDTGLDGQENLDLIAKNIPSGSIVQFPENGAYLRVVGYVLDNNNVMMFGALLTPVANENATDSRLKVEYGYVDLMPGYQQWIHYPHPTKVAFYNQRLWAGDWIMNPVEGRYSLVIGSQIAKYNDFENNYNQENEAITLDILTQFKENIEFLGDYNGLKIMTDAFEYDYNNGAPTRQSSNGVWATCEPIIFESLCLYADASGQSIRAMQYEFQSNVFNSSVINQFAPKDLIWHPLALASYEDKFNSTGKYLFVANEDSDDKPKLVVCNFEPNNQAMIWSRWAFPNTTLKDNRAEDMEVNIINNVVQTKKYPIFLINMTSASTYFYDRYALGYVVPAIIDFDAQADLVGYIYNAPNIGNLKLAIFAKDFRSVGDLMEAFVLRNTEVAVYSGDVFQFLTKTGAYGEITDDLTGLTDVRIKLPINATVRSHPIDVGGKTKSIKKRIGKTVMSVHNTEAGAITINGKTGYMNPQGDKISFYGVTGMKDEIRYTLTNKNGAMFHLESLLMNIEYGTLDS